MLHRLTLGLTLVVGGAVETPLPIFIVGGIQQYLALTPLIVFVYFVGSFVLHCSARDYESEV